MRRLIALLLISAGGICLLWYAEQWRAAAAFQHQQAQALHAALSRAPVRSAPSAVRARIAPHGLVGRLDIPRVHLSTMVVEGDDAGTLEKAVGHLPDTAMPWERGNTVLAGHRDTFFRPLKDVRPGDEIRLVSPRGTYAYRVVNTKITTPTDVRVLAPQHPSELTLLTCYPFYYVGAAPKRYVVRAVALGPKALYDP